MSHVCSSPVDCVHLLALKLDRYINEESRIAVACTAPNNIRGRAVIPGCDLSNHSIALRGNSEVCTDVHETLLERVQGLGLEEMLKTTT